MRYKPGSLTCLPSWIRDRFSGSGSCRRIRFWRQRGNGLRSYGRKGSGRRTPGTGYKRCACFFPADRRKRRDSGRTISIWTGITGPSCAPSIRRTPICGKRPGGAGACASFIRNFGKPSSASSSPKTTTSSGSAGASKPSANATGSLWIFRGQKERAAFLSRIQKPWRKAVWKGCRDLGLGIGTNIS